MKPWSKWILTGCAIAIVVLGIGFLLWKQDPVLSHKWWKNNSSTVIKIAVPALAALLARASQQLISSRLKQSTPEQLEQARQQLAGRGLEWWRNVPLPAWPGDALPRAGLSPLDVYWAAPPARAEPPTTAEPAAQAEPLAAEPAAPAGPPAAAPPGARPAGYGAPPERAVEGSVKDVATLARRFRQARPCRLVIRGDTGSGKSVLARLLMAELLKRRQPGDPVPVFLPLASWDPRRERLNHWMKRRVGEDAPELRDEASYGPTAVTNLVDQGMILPVLDGLDCLPEASRKAVLSSGELLSQDRFIITCRSDEFDAVSGFTVIAPHDVPADTALSFLREVTDCPGQWEQVRQHIESSPDGPLARVLVRPRSIFLASLVYRKDTSEPTELTRVADYPSESTIYTRLLDQVVHAFMPPEGTWAADTPWYEDRVQRWAGSLARMELQVADMPGITWWNLHRRLAWLDRHQAAVRGLAAGLITFGLGLAAFHGIATYSVMTSASYALVIFIAGVLLGQPDAPQDRDRGEDRGEGGRAAAYRGPVLLWWLTHTWPRRWRALAAGAASFVCFGVLIGLRTDWLTKPDPKHGIYLPDVAIRTGLWDGVIMGLTVILTFAIAGTPRPPRSMRAQRRGGADRAEWLALVRAVLIGIAFGLLYGVTAVIKHQHPTVPTFGQAIPAGLITGVDFAVGAWLFSWSQIWFRPARAASPRTAAHAELAGALLRPFILGATFAFAFGLSAPFNFTSVDVTAWFVVGTVVGHLASEWPLYGYAVGWLAIRKEIPARILKFLDCCRDRGILRVVGEAYQFHDDALRDYLRHGGIAPVPAGPGQPGPDGPGPDEPGPDEQAALDPAVGSVPGTAAAGSAPGIGAER